MRELLCIIILFSSTILYGQSNKNNKRDIANNKIKEIINKGTRINSDSVYTDTIYKYSILIKGDSYLNKSSTQIHVLLETPRDLSYMLVFGPSDPEVSSIAEHWSIIFKKRNQTFKILNLQNDFSGVIKKENAKFEITKYGKNLTGELRTYDTGKFLYILHIFTSKGKWKENIETINQIFNSFEIL